MDPSASPRSSAPISYWVEGAIQEPSPHVETDVVEGLMPASEIPRRIKVHRIAPYAINGAVFASSSFYVISELLGSQKVVPLTLCLLMNGVSASNLSHLPFSAEFTKKASALISSWSYETVFAFSQIYRNFVPKDQQKLFALPFIWLLGYFISNDVHTMINLKQRDVPHTPIPPEVSELLPTLGFKTRDYSKGAILWLAATLVSAVALTILNFSIRESYPDLGDFGNIGLYQDLIALFSGSVVGDLFARILDDRKERLEKEIYRERLEENDTAPLLPAQRLPTQLPIKLICLRIAKSVLLLATPLLTSPLLAAPTAPNSGGDFATKFSVGLLYGAQLLAAKREFEIPKDSPSLLENHHPNYDGKIIAIAKQILPIFCFKPTFKKYAPPVVFLISLTSYMGVVAANNTSRADYAILSLMLATCVSFFAADQFAGKYHPSQSNRWLNECAFRLIYSPLNLSIVYQYLTTKVDIGDEELNSDSTPLYILSLVAWGWLGFVWGDLRALFAQGNVPGFLPITAPLATEELSKTFVSNLS